MFCASLSVDSEGVFLIWISRDSSSVSWFLVFICRTLFWITGPVPPCLAPAALTYMVIGGQHAVETLRLRREALFAENLDVPDVHRTVMATVP